MSGAPRSWVVWAEGPAGLDPLDLLSAPEGEAFYWECPERREALAASGAVQVLEGRGERRLERVAEQVVGLVDRVRPLGEEGPWGSALLVGGFAFEGAAQRGSRWEEFGDARFVLPRELVLCRGGRTLLAAASAAGPGEARAGLARLSARLSEPRCEGAPAEASEMRVAPERSAAHYRRLVARALEAIRAGEVEKLVLARALRVESPGEFALLRLLRALRRAHPTSTAFGAVRGRRAFLGATPERLLRVEGDAVFADAVAGSAPRGRSPGSDARLRCQLRESKKEHEEHAFVARHVARVLERSCGDVQSPEAPAVLATEGIQHLHTPFRARRRGAGILELAARLHPTPAVAGVPAPRACRWLRRFEGLERGWYAGGVGWLGTSGEGELSVALRSALLEPGRATLYAGAGIVRDSEPEAELAETRLKLGALLQPLLEL